MLENCTTIQERWNGVDKLVGQLLNERQELLVLYCSLCGVQPVTKGNDRSTGEGVRSQAKIKRFCAILVDYVSAGHFEVYEQLLREADAFKQDGIGLLARYYPVIERSTELAVAFSDKHADSADTRTLSRDLSRLGESLEARFEAEDILIESLHIANRAQAV